MGTINLELASAVQAKSGTDKAVDGSQDAGTKVDQAGAKTEKEINDTSTKMEQDVNRAIADLRTTVQNFVNTSQGATWSGSTRNRVMEIVDKAFSDIGIVEGKANTMVAQFRANNQKGLATLRAEVTGAFQKATTEYGQRWGSLSQGVQALHNNIAEHDSTAT